MGNVVRIQGLGVMNAALVAVVAGGTTWSGVVDQLLISCARSM
jgi:hypothetical protein